MFSFMICTCSVHICICEIVACCFVCQACAQRTRCIFALRAVSSEFMLFELHRCVFDTCFLQAIRKYGALWANALRCVRLKWTAHVHYMYMRAAWSWKFCMHLYIASASLKIKCIAVPFSSWMKMALWGTRWWAYQLILFNHHTPIDLSAKMNTVSIICRQVLPFYWQKAQLC